MSGRAKKIALVILVIELIIIATVAYRQSTHNRLTEPVRITQEEMSLERTGAPVEAGFYVDGSFEGTDRSIRTPAVAVPRGIYQVTVTYETDFFDDMYRIDCASQAFSVREGSPYEQELSSRSILYAHNDSVSYRVNVDDNEGLLVRNTLSDDAGTYLLIRDVQLHQLTRLSVLNLVLRWIFFFIVLDSCVVCGYLFARREWFRITVAKNALTITALILIFFAVNMTLFMNDTLHGHDIDFHIFRIIGVADSIRAGDPFARVQPSWNGQYGYAVGVYYGQGLLYPSAVLYLLGFSIDASYRFLCLMINAIGITSSYIAFRKISGNSIYGVTGCALFSLSVYRLADVFLRSAIGEAVAISFMPLIILGIWMIYNEGSGHRGWIVLGVGAVGVITSHTLSTFIIAVFCVFYAIMRWKCTILKPVYTALLKAVVLTVSLTAHRLVPMMDYMITMEIQETSMAANREFQRTAAEFIQIFANVYQAAGTNESESVLREMPLTIGFFSLCVIGIAMYLLLSGYKGKSPDLKMVFFITMFSIFAASTLFPWRWIQNELPAIYRVFNHLQFTWRFLLIPVGTIPLLFVLSLNQMERIFKAEVVNGVALVIGIVACFEALVFMSAYITNMPPRDEVKLRDSFSLANGEYLPAGADTYLMREVRVPETEDAALVQATIENRDGTTLISHVENHLDRGAYIDYPVLYYKGYRAAGEDGILPIWGGDHARIRVTVPAGYEGTVRVYFQEPFYWRIAELVSALTLMWLVVYLVRTRRAQGQPEQVTT